MKKIEFLFFVAIILSPNYSYAELSIYTVDGKFEAMFPSQPQLLGELGQGDYRIRGFNAIDYANAVVYTAGYQVNRSLITELNVDQEIKSYIMGHALAVDGAITYQSIGRIGNEIGGYFSIDFIYRGIAVKKYGVVIYHDGRFYHWAIQDVPNASKADGRNIFDKYVKYFRIINASVKVEENKDRREQEELARKLADEAASTKAQKEAEDMRAKNCEVAKKNLKVLQGDSPVVKTDAKGNKVALDSQQREAELKKAQKDQEYFCNP